MRWRAKDTKIIEAAARRPLHAGAVNTPVYRVSTVLFPIFRPCAPKRSPIPMVRRWQPTTRALEQALCSLEGGARTVLRRPASRPARLRS